MKGIMLTLAFLGVFALTSVQAQSCSKTQSTANASCCAKSSADGAAAQAASLDNTIQRRVNAETGEVTYVRKTVCETSGKTSYDQVEYCTKSAKFINVSPQKQNCTKPCTEGTAKGASATKVSNKSTSCCTEAEKAACCPNGSKTGASAKTSSNASVKLVKNQN
ncbi:MAG TPA: hypothetical protein PKA00_04000 [Saprospiraceae bacterium]|nr:hypothetical protein [Saprospiraceae bacterium]HMQ82041.1 hypothetical protein [Saprospiraceae bacterium]